MDKYTIHCTEEQTKKALELGAPIELANSFNDYLPHEMIDYVSERGNVVCAEFIFPTAEQMIGWLEEQESDMRFEVATGIAHTWHYYIHLNYNSHYHNLFNSGYHSRSEATLAAIDIALDYLGKTMEE